ncbi:MAG: glycosyltransferase [Deltaproteobacteria bacterium]|nr:glycosyltransferase [Deltaproteobacteria bacterium]
MPELSVVMSAYNCEQYIGQAIESILAQTFTDFEFIIINDGSADDTGNLIDSYRDERITVLHQENKGLISALNTGVGHARTSLIARMDADDIALPERLSVQLTWMNRNPEVGLLGTGCRYIDSQGRPSGEPMQASGTHAAVLHTLLHAGRGPAIIHPTVMMRKEAFQRAGGYNERFPVCEDVDLWLRIAFHAQLAVMPDIQLQYRRHSTSISFTARQTQLLSGILTRSCYYRRERGQPDPSLASDMEWKAFQERACEKIERCGLFAADAARATLSVLLFNHRGTMKYAAGAAALLRRPALLPALFFRRRWRNVIMDLARSA